MATDSQQQPTPQDYTTRLNHLADQRNTLVSRHARLVAVKEQAEQQVVQLQQEMTALSTTPETLDQDVANAEASLAQSVEQAEASMAELDLQLTTAEQTLDQANPLNQ